MSVSAMDSMYTANLPPALMDNTRESLPGFGSSSHQQKKCIPTSDIYTVTQTDKSVYTSQL